jgi:hypothetical protein
MIDSALKTSTNADVAIYVDEDQEGQYKGFTTGALLTIGDRIGPVKSMNELVRLHPGYVAYGAATDDCEFVSPGWDRWVMKTAAAFKSGIGVMAPRSNGSERMDFPWATSEWIEVVGHLAWPACVHYYWDIMIELLGEATQIAYAANSDFAIKHLGLPGKVEITMTTRALADARNLLPSIALERPKIIRKLRDAIAARAGVATT